MTAATTTRFVDRKTHDCGCVTVWYTDTRGVRYVTACSIHRGYAERFQADLQPKE